MPSLSLSVFRNMLNVIGATNANHYLIRPRNIAFHDLTKDEVVPPIVKSLLGLSKKFIPTPKLTKGAKDLEEA